jgi:hypothetical protein
LHRKNPYLNYRQKKRIFKQNALSFYRPQAKVESGAAKNRSLHETPGEQRDGAFDYRRAVNFGRLAEKAAKPDAFFIVSLFIDERGHAPPYEPVHPLRGDMYLPRFNYALAFAAYFF